MRKRYARPLAVAALTAGVSLGIAAGPAASAAPGDAGSPKAHAKADKRLAVAKKVVLSHVAHKDAALARVSKKISHAHLAAALADAVAANSSGDRAALGELGAAAKAAATVSDVRAVGAQVRHVSPEVYSVVVNGLRRAVHFDELVAANAAAVADLSAQADAKELEGYDVSAVREMLASAAMANDNAAASTSAAVDKGMTLTAFGSHEERTGFQAGLAAAGESLDAVEEQLQAAADALAAMVPAEQSVA